MLNLKSRKEAGPGFQHFDKIMPEKKTHEVEIMSDCVNNLCEDNDAHFIVDLGKGYVKLMRRIVAYINEYLKIKNFLVVKNSIIICSLFIIKV